MRIYFVTRNTFKMDELRRYLDDAEGTAPLNVEICMVQRDVQEILHHDIDTIVQQKALQAYQYLGLPCVVEHGGLFMDALPGLPGGVGQVVWDAVGDRMCGFLGPDDSRAAVARSILGYCDGRRIHIYRGETRGHVTERSRGDYQFHWDPIFVPEGSEQTYGEMGPEKKRATAPTVKAWERFLRQQFPA